MGCGVAGAEPGVSVPVRVRLAAGCYPGPAGHPRGWPPAAPCAARLAVQPYLHPAAWPPLPAGGAAHLRPPPPLQCRIYNLRETRAIRDLNPCDINKLVAVSGMVTRTSGISPDQRSGRARLAAVWFGGGINGERPRAAGAAPARRCSNLHHPTPAPAPALLGAALQPAPLALLLPPLPPLPARSLALFQCTACAAEEVCWNDRGRIAEPARCPNPACQARFSMAMIYNRSCFLDKQLMKMQVLLGGGGTASGVGWGGLL